MTDLANQKYALYQNTGDGSFTYASYTSGIGAMTLLHSGWGIRFLDYDNDGRKDLLIAQGHDLDTIEKTFPQLHYREPMLLARNADGNKFVDVSPISGDVFTKRWVGRGMAIGDINNDGLLDAVVTENGGPAHVLLNKTQTGQSLAWHQARRSQEQPGRHWRGHQNHDFSWATVGDGDDECWLFIVERSARSLWFGQRRVSADCRNSVAEWYCADT